MSSGMPELGSKISLISKADIRYEGRLFTVDPQECTIALASVRSFGTEDRETQYPVAPQSQVYDYILFRGSDIKDIRVLNNVPSLPNDPAIMQMSVPASLGGTASAPGQYSGQFGGVHPVVGQPQYPQYHPMAGFPGSVHAQLNKTSELSPQTSVELAPGPHSHPQPPSAGPIGSGVQHHSNQVKDQGSMLDLIGGGSQQNASRSNTPAVTSHRKSPTADQGTQVGNVASGSGARESRRGSTGGGGGGGGPASKQQQRPQRTNSRNRQRYPSGGSQPQHQPPAHQPHHQNHQQSGVNFSGHNNTGGPMGGGGGYLGGRGGGGGWRGGRSRGRGRGFVPRNKNTLKFDNDYDFEQANTEFEELRTQLAKTKISDEPIKPDEVGGGASADGVGSGGGVVAEADKKDDSGNETGAGEPELDDDPYTGYDKTKSFFDNISCEAVERSKGRSQRTDWRTERKLNSETFGVASARRGAWRQRASWRHNPHHQQMSYFPSWRPMRGGRGRPNNMNNMGAPRINQPRNAPPSAQAPPQQAPASAAAK